MEKGKQKGKNIKIESKTSFKKKNTHTITVEKGTCIEN